MNLSFFNLIVGICYMCLEKLLGQTITLKYKQEDSATHCTQGLIEGDDDVIFKSKVNFSTDSSMKYVYFQTMRRDEKNYDYLCDFSVQENCIPFDSTLQCNCEKKEPFILEITIILKASISYSGSLIRGIAIRSDNNFEISSKEILFPEIISKTHTVGELVINGQHINFTKNDCGEHTSGPELNIYFSCKSAALPCVIEIGDASNKMVQGNNNLTFSRLYDETLEVNVTIKYAACRLEGIYNTLNCRIRIDGVNNVPRRKQIITVFYIACANIIMLLVYLMACYLKRPGTECSILSCLTVSCGCKKKRINDYDDINQGYLIVDYGIFRENDDYDRSGYTIVPPKNLQEPEEHRVANETNIYEYIDNEEVFNQHDT